MRNWDPAREMTDQLQTSWKNSEETQQSRGAARRFSENYKPFAGAEIFAREHACVRAEIFFGHLYMYMYIYWKVFVTSTERIAKTPLILKSPAATN